MEEYELAEKNLLVMFVHLEKAFYYVPRKVRWEALRRKGEVGEK